MILRRKIPAALMSVSAAFVAQPLVAQRAARMAVPEDFSARAERIHIDGFGGRNEGHYTFGDHSGDFTRIESRFSIGDPLYAQSRGKSSFTLSGPGFADTIDAQCEMRRQAVTIGVVTFDPEKMSYHCSFEGAAATPASLVLAEPEPENLRARVLALSDRRGETRLGDVTLAIRSVHRYADSRLLAPTPVGYVLEHEDRMVGALELTDVDPTLLLLADEADQVRMAAFITALALAVLRDPATSPLEE
jgi:hypothetical protein